LSTANGVRYGGAILASPFGDCFLCQSRLVHQAFECSRGFNGVQIFTLDVFNERHFQGEIVDTCRTMTGTFVKPRALGARQRRSPAMSWYREPMGRTTKG